jgi:hypothetical protein
MNDDMLQYGDIAAGGLLICLGARFLDAPWYTPFV